MKNIEYRKKYKGQIGTLPWSDQKTIAPLCPRSGYFQIDVGPSGSHGALRVAKAASKSSVLILLDLSAAFDTEPSDPSVHHLITCNSLHWFESYLIGRTFRVVWRGIQSTSTDHRCSPGFSAWTAPLLHLHHITGSHHTGFYTIAMLMTLSSTSHFNQMIPQ
ncbi:hypothetical protein F2P79_004110 [Pimephales promelas]|nr:hypothetical protein F2P79_004110 [Pimephales promelas]